MSLLAVAHQARARWAAGKLKISQEATVLRLEQIHLYKSGSYDKWCALVHNDNPDFSEKGGGSKAPAQEKVKLAKYGFRFAKAFKRLLHEGAISEINLYRVSGLKPKYQRPYFDYVIPFQRTSSKIWISTMAKKPESQCTCVIDTSGLHELATASGNLKATLIVRLEDGTIGVPSWAWKEFKRLYQEEATQLADHIVKRIRIPARPCRFVLRGLPKNSI